MKSKIRTKPTFFVVFLTLSKCAHLSCSLHVCMCAFSLHVCMYACCSNDQCSASPHLQKYSEQCCLVGDQKSLREQRSVTPAQAVLQWRAITICIIFLWKYFWSVGCSAKVTLILQLRGDELQMSSQKHTPLTFPCWSTVRLQRGMRSMNGDRRACHSGDVKPAEQVGCRAWSKSPSSRLVQRGCCSGEHQSTNYARL